MSKFKFDSIEHALASVAHDTVVGARASAEALGKAQKAAPEIESITGLVDPQAVIIERAAFAALGALAKAANDTKSATAAKGVSVPLDQETINDYKQLYKILADKLKAQGQTLSTPNSAPQPIPAAQGA